MFNPTDITPSVDDVLAMSQQAMNR